MYADQYNGNTQLPRPQAPQLGMLMANPLIRQLLTRQFMQQPQSANSGPIGGPAGGITFQPPVNIANPPQQLPKRPPFQIPILPGQRPVSQPTPITRPVMQKQRRVGVDGHYLGGQWVPYNNAGTIAPTTPVAKSGPGVKPRPAASTGYIKLPRRLIPVRG